MKKLSFKIYRLLLNQNSYPLNIWGFFLIGCVKVFLFLLLYNTFFLNHITNHEFIDGVMYSFVFTFIIMFFRVIGLFNPFQFFIILYDTIEKITDTILLKVLRMFRK